ncbi:dihydrolipoyl dehydrogenase family protein [Bacillus marinisedimentorum]|uniref:dihydrolipoyl dehydrogenase family protein n=1 Tax=Bacillus marinisedimentorum TaxID=1821260 RepID=UPI000871C5CD|nr:FAD-dependent oxidoreductase [Bacillus marinisedimentorum]
MKEYQVIVIGGGAGGLTVAAGAASLGATVAVVEKSKNPGGDCLHSGCVPSKALIEAARSVYDIGRAAVEFGLEMDGKPSFQAAMERVKASIAKIQTHDSIERFAALGVDFYEGSACFADEHIIEIHGKEQHHIRGRRIIIATGSRPFIPQIPGLDSIHYITNETVFSLERLPERIVTVGAGPTGLEVSQALARLGARVTVLEIGKNLLPGEDRGVVQCVKGRLEKELSIRLGCNIIHVKGENGETVLTVEQNGVTDEIRAEALFLAAGRLPNTDGLCLEKAGVKTENGYVKVDRCMRTSNKHIYAVGDVTGKYMFTHAAGMEGKIAVSNAVFGLSRKVRYDSLPWVTYTDPEIYHLGLTEKEARLKYGSSIEVYKAAAGDVDRFITAREKEGLLKVITDKKGNILGAHAAGKDASTWMQQLVYAKHHNRKIGTISSVIHPYPTRGAIIQQAADQYWRQKLFNGPLNRILKNYVKWML